MSKPNLSRRTFLRNLALVGGGIAALAAIYYIGTSKEKKEEKAAKTTGGIPATIDTPINYGVEYSMIIPGTSLDVDSMRLSGTLDGLQLMFETFDVKKNFAYENLKYGATAEDVDFRWHHINKSKRQLEPENGELAILKKGFEDVTLDDLMSAPYSNDIIDGSDSNNQLKPGTIIAIKTSKGNYAKMRIDEYLPLILNIGLVQRIEDMILRSPSEDSQNYHLKCTFVLYRPH